MLLRVGPGAKLFAIVAKDEDRVGKALRDATQIVDGLLRSLKGNEVAERLTAGKDGEEPAVILGDVVAVKLVFDQASIFEMEVVQNRVLHAGIGQVTGEGLLPDALGHPHPLDVGTQAIFEPGGVGLDLADPIAGGDHRQNRLVKRAADDFDAPRGNEPRQAVHVFGVAVVEPLHEGTAGMEGDAQLRPIAFKDVQEGAIAVLISLLEHAVKIADRLMVVQNQAKAKRIHGDEAGGPTDKSGVWGLVAPATLYRHWLPRLAQGRRRRVQPRAAAAPSSPNHRQIQPDLASVSKRKIRKILPRRGERRAEQPGSRFGGNGIDEHTGTPFEAGHFDQTRKDLDMPVIMVIAVAVKGRGMQKVVVMDSAQGRFDTTDDLLHEPGKFPKLSSFQILVAGALMQGCDADLIGEPASEGAKGHPAIGQGDDAVLGCDLGLGQAGKQAGAGLLMVAGGEVNLVGNLLGHMVQSQKLAMGMFDGGPGCGTDVFEHLHIAEGFIPAMGENPVLVGPKDEFRLSRSEVGQAHSVTGGFDNDLMPAKCRLPGEECWTGRGGKRRVRDARHSRVLVGNHPNGPGGRYFRLPCGESVSSDGIWRFVLVPRAKRTQATFPPSNLFDELAGTRVALTTDDDPLPGQRILAILGHVAVGVGGWAGKNEKGPGPQSGAYAFYVVVRRFA